MNLKMDLLKLNSTILFAMILTGCIYSPIAFGDAHQTHDAHLFLFVDDHWIAEQHNLTRVMNTPEVLPDPVIWPDNPATEKDCAWGNVIREPDGRYRLWYTTAMLGHKGKGGHEMASAGVWGKGSDFSFNPRSDSDVRETEYMLGKYAESSDGIRWTKPKLSLVEFRGSRENNIILTGRRAAEQTNGALTNVDGFTVVRDDAETNPSRRYKMIAHWESVHFWDNHEVSGSLGRPAELMKKYGDARGKYITYSPDGVRWDQALTRLDIDGFGDRCLVVRDHRHGQWWLNNRPPIGSKSAGAGLATSQDLIHWTATENVLPRPETPETDHPVYESLIPFNYGNQDLGFLITQVKRSDKKELLAYLASHHDGESWTRIARIPHEPLIPPGPPGSYYASGAVPLQNEPLIVKDKLYIYFNAFSYYQDKPCPFGLRSIGLATLRRDGFVSLDTGEKSGYVLIKPFTLPKGNLHLNTNAAKGQVHVAILDENGKTFKGFEKSKPITGDKTDVVVQWEDANLADIAGQKVKLRISGTNCKLYSYWFD